MRRWSWVKAGLLLIALVLVAGGVLGYVVKREPDFYAQATAVAPQADDPAVASDTQTRIGDLVRALTVPYAAPGEWQVSFTADELNAFLREEDDVLILRPKWEGFTDPRVSIREDRLMIGGRSGDGWSSVVLSVEVRAWLVAGEPNTFAIELVNVGVGSLPWLKQWLMDRLTKFATDYGADVTWYRGRGGNPTAICRLKANQNQPDLVLTELSIGDGKIVIGGKGLLGQ